MSADINDIAPEGPDFYAPDDGPKAQHTPGPWRLCQLSNDEATYGTNAGRFIVVSNDGGDEITGAIHNDDDAILIATAPELLEALTQLLGRLDHHGNIDLVREEGPIQDARAAIAKAEGRE